MDTTKTYSQRLIAWHKRHGRHDLPWQLTADPYQVWLSEIMLQQTQVASVIPYYRRFLWSFPTLQELAAAPLEQVMALWSGLGYYARARNLHRCARIITSRHGGRFPEQPTALAELPGIGRSTANAIAVFCFGARAAILDGNVKRVLCRTHGIKEFPGAAATEKRLWRLAESLLPRSNVATYIQAQMDLGATVCTRREPACLAAAASCPVADLCIARNTGCIDELPAPRPRKVLPKRETRVLVLWDGDCVLLERRPPSGIWGGLLSLPEVDGTSDPTEYILKTLGCTVTGFAALPSLRHNFTHFQLTLLPLSGVARMLPGVADPAGYCWVKRGDIDTAALPTPVRKILGEFFRQAMPGDAPAPAPG
ncbi:MAG: A/G-specific adenine glycosylase [Betaproteobacteria bacterium]|nr:A/G-specific adenine glycosylase [Betaproteobacteria bacterium]